MHLTESMMFTTLSPIPLHCHRTCTSHTGSSVSPTNHKISYILQVGDNLKMHCHQFPPFSPCHLCKSFVLPKITVWKGKTPPTNHPCSRLPRQRKEGGPRIQLAAHHLKGSWTAHFVVSFSACSISKDLFASPNQPYLSNAKL